MTNNATLLARYAESLREVAKARRELELAEQMRARKEQ